MKPIYSGLFAGAIALLQCIVLQGANADPLYGVSTRLQAYDAGPDPSETEISISNSTTIPFSQSTSETGNGTGQARVGVSFGSRNVGLHVFGSANSPANVGESYGNSDLWFFDTLSIAGSGTQVFQYTLTLNGSAQLIGDPLNGLGSSGAYGSLGLFLDSSYSTWGTVLPDSGCSSSGFENGNLCGGISGIDINEISQPTAPPVTGEIALQGGTSVEIGLFLLERTIAYDAYGSVSSTDVLAEFNAADTGFLTLTPVTPGASFTSASGLTYASDPDTPTGVPEPNSLALLAAGIAGFALIRHCCRTQ